MIFYIDLGRKLVKSHLFDVIEKIILQEQTQNNLNI